MKLHELKEQIVSKKVDQLLLFSGEEIAIMDVYIKKVAEVVGVPLTVCETVQEAYGVICQRQLSGEPRCVIVREDKEFIKQEEPIWEKVFDAVSSSADYLILVYYGLDKRGKFYKRYKDEFTDFEKLPVETLAQYIQKLLKASPSMAANLATICDCDYSRILIECDKINMYSRAKNITPEQAFEALKAAGNIFQPIGDITFKFTDAILMRDKQYTAKLLMQARQKQEPEMVVLSVLYTNFKHILMVQGLGADQSEPSARTGLTPWQVKCAKERQGHYSLPELVKALKLIQATEKGIKTGEIDVETCLEYLIVNIL